jgi:hypothetical protein
MCWNGDCFSLESLGGKKVAVMISGPGYLEYSWAYETALRLSNAGAAVQLIDLAKCANTYAMRVKFKRFLMPVASRTILRFILLKGETRVENVMEKKATSNGIVYRAYAMKSFQRLHRGESLKIEKFENEFWGNVNACSILATFFSSLMKKKIEPNTSVPSSLVYGIKSSVEKACVIADNLSQENLHAVFLANGRQPIQAALTLTLRKNGLKVYLYEAAGGYIFPRSLVKCIDYWQSNPANSFETQQKINCVVNLSDTISNNQLATEVLDKILKRQEIAFSLDYLTDRATNFEIRRNEKGRNFAFFTTSEWELSVLNQSIPDEYVITEFANQISSVKELLKLMKDDDRLYLRLHPNDPGNQATEDDLWNELHSDKRVIIIESGSRADSYEIAAQMDAVFVWTSFIGVELTLRDLPVGVLGDAVYAGCFGSNWLNSPSKLRAWLSNPKKVEKDSLLPYANFLAKGGYPIVSSQTSLGKIDFLGGLPVDVARLRITSRWKLVQAIS